MKVIVTGCNGKLGSATCETLLAAGHVVVGIDASAAADRPHRVIVDTLLNPYALHRAIDLLGGQADALVHLANHTNSLAAPAEVVLRENLAMNTSVFTHAWQSGVGRVIFASSVQAMIGGAEIDGTPSVRHPVRIPIDESMPPRPTNVYGLSKVLTEQMLDHLTTTERFGKPLSAVSLRMPFIMLSKWFENAVTRTGTSDWMWGGAECFSYIVREDAAEAVRLAVEATTSGHEAFWIAAPDPRVPVGENVAMLVDKYYASVPGADEARRRDSLMNCDKAERVLGWRATRIIRDERARRGLLACP